MTSRTNGAASLMMSWVFTVPGHNPESLKILQKKLSRCCDPSSQLRQEYSFGVSKTLQNPQIFSTVPEHGESAPAEFYGTSQFPVTPPLAWGRNKDYRTIYKPLAVGKYLKLFLLLPK